MAEFEMKEMVELILVIFIAVGGIAIAVTAFGGLDGVYETFCKNYPDWCGGGTKADDIKVMNSGEALKEAAEYVVTMEDEGDIPDDKWKRVCEERGWVYCLKTDCEQIKREIKDKSNVCCAKDKCKTTLIPSVGGAIRFANNGDKENEEGEESVTILSQIGKETWVSCGDYAQIEYDEDRPFYKTKTENIWYMYNLDSGWLWRSELEGYQNYRPVSDPVGEEFFSKVDDIYKTIINGLKGKRYDVPGSSGISVIRDALRSRSDDELTLHLANGDETEIDHGDERKINGLADLADFKYADSCTVYNFHLPQDVPSSTSYITLMGDPRYMIYYEKFPEDVDGAWSYTSSTIIFATAAVGGFLNIGMGGLKLTGKAIKEGTLVLIRKKALKEAGEAIMAKTVKEFGGLKILSRFAIKKLLLGRWIRQETTDAVENIVKMGFKRIVKKESYMKGLKNVDMLADELYYVVKPLGKKFSKETLPEITEREIGIAVQNLKNKGVQISMDDTSRAALAGRLKSIRNDMIDGHIDLIPAEHELMEKAIFGGEIKEGLITRTFEGLKSKLGKLFKRTEEIIKVGEEAGESIAKESLDETVEQVAKEEFVKLNDLLWVPKEFRDRYLKEAEEAMLQMGAGARTKLMQKAESLVQGLKGSMGMPPKGFPSKGRTYLMATILAGGYVAMLVDSKFSKYNEPCGENTLCVFTPKGFKLENIEKAGILSENLRDYWWTVKTPKILGNEWSTGFYIASPCQADLLVTKGKCGCEEYMNYNEVVVEIKQKICCDPADVKWIYYGLYGSATHICANNQIPTDSEDINQRLNPSCPVICEAGATYNKDLMRCEIGTSTQGSCTSGYEWDSDSEICWKQGMGTNDFEPIDSDFDPRRGFSILTEIPKTEILRISPNNWQAELDKILKDKNKNFNPEYIESDYYANKYQNSMYWVLSNVLNQANGVMFKQCTSGDKIEVDCIKVEVKNQDRYSDTTNPNFCIDNKAEAVDYVRAGLVGVEIVGSIAITIFTGGWAAPVSLYVIGSGSVLTDAFLKRKGLWPNNQNLN